eukprot:scaffold5295_cov28-Tisochrysis_lutea.AAC.2
MLPHGCRFQLLAICNPVFAALWQGRPHHAPSHTQDQGQHLARPRGAGFLCCGRPRQGRSSAATPEPLMGLV